MMKILEAWNIIVSSTKESNNSNENFFSWSKTNRFSKSPRHPFNYKINKKLQQQFRRKESRNQNERLPKDRENYQSVVNESPEEGTNFNKRGRKDESNNNLERLNK